ncbi:MarR family winged helix-turn-helix transcriptional regulator [Jonesia quinghaiensis]|uniref:MarR family winged helix-turn-helix transcriptional regulator n=1 Tax=Jonesia quinghaiensis TaxID=262806 RepID=UPI00041603DB|nr:MarR family transcriptional regulator [Jonesia quinghaiensis]
MTTNDHIDRIQKQWRTQRPDLDVTPQGTYGRLSRIADHVTAELNTTFSDHGISDADFDILAALRRAGKPYQLTPSDITATTMMTSGGTSKRIDSLERRQLVQRQPAHDDARSCLVSLTKHGLETVDQAITQHMANEHRMLARFTPAERKQLQTLLTTWLSHYE